MRRAKAAGAVAMCALTAMACSDATGPGNHYEGTFSGSFVETFVSQSGSGGGTLTCRYTINVTGTVELNLDTTGASASGDGTIKWTETPVVTSLDQGCSQYSQGGTPRTIDVGGDVTGTPDQLQISAGYTSTATSSQPMTVVTSARFTGASAGGAVSGTLSISRTGSGTVVSQGPNGTTQSTTTQQSASGSFPVTLR